MQHSFNLKKRKVWGKKKSLARSLNKRTQGTGLNTPSQSRRLHLFTCAHTIPPGRSACETLRDSLLNSLKVTVKKVPRTCINTCDKMEIWKKNVSVVTWKAGGSEGSRADFLPFRVPQDSTYPTLSLHVGSLHLPLRAPGTEGCGAGQGHKTNTGASKSITSDISHA